MRIAGIDLAWKPETNGSAIAIGHLKRTTFTIEDIFPQVLSLGAVTEVCKSALNLHGVAIDAPLILRNSTGSRSCEKELSKAYGSRNASCHSSNLGKYPNAASVQLSDCLSEWDHKHLGSRSSRWQIECYPHPAIIEFFDLPERLPFKKGKVADKRAGQIKLANHIVGLANIGQVKIGFSELALTWLDPTRINLLKGQALKQSEDALDAIVCALIGLWYQLELESHTFGNTNDGYIYVPSKARA